MSRGLKNEETIKILILIINPNMSDFDVFDQIAEQINESNVIKEDSTPITEQTDGCLHENIIEEYGISSCQDCGIQLKKN